MSGLAAFLVGLGIGVLIGVVVVCAVMAGASDDDSERGSIGGTAGDD